MSWFWKKKKEEDPFEVDLARLMKWREDLLRSAYCIRLLDLLATRHILGMDSAASEDLKKVLVKAWEDGTMNMSSIWSVIGDIEGVLTFKYGKSFANPIVFQDTQLHFVKAKIAAYERTMPTVRPGQPEADQASRNPQGQTQ